MKTHFFISYHRYHRIQLLASRSQKILNGQHPPPLMNDQRIGRETGHNLP